MYDTERTERLLAEDCAARLRENQLSIGNEIEGLNSRLTAQDDEIFALKARLKRQAKSRRALNDVNKVHVQ